METNQGMNGVRMLLAVLVVMMGAGGARAEGLDRGFADLEGDTHDYWHAPLADPFTPRIEALESGRFPIDTRSERAALESILHALDIPVSSQTWVFSTTSLQLGLISPRNPRTIYFNESVYLGHMPGGKIEIVSIDPQLGGIFYIFDLPLGGKRVSIDRSDRCMNCHASKKTGYVPGVVLKSVMPGPRGGSLDAYRRDEIGHHVALSERFGGWHVTGAPGFETHYGNQIGEYRDGELVTEVVMAGERFDVTRYPVATSDILPHLILEHQAGLTNRLVEAHYRIRHELEEAKGRPLAKAVTADLDARAMGLARTMLFLDEAAFPEGGFAGDRAYREAFAKGRRVDGQGRSLRDLDLETRLFRYRCSYMIYEPVFEALPAWFQKRIFHHMRAAWEAGEIPAGEAAVVEGILRETGVGFTG